MPLVLASHLIEVVVETEPWNVSFRVAGVGLESAGTLSFRKERRWPPGPNPPSDETPLEGPDSDWSHLAEAQDETSEREHYRTRVRTTLDGHTAEIAIALIAGGEAVSVRADITGAAVTRQMFSAQAGERWLGFGERSHASVLERGVIENYVGEGPYQPHEYPFLDGIVPPWGLRNRPDATYFPIPWVLSNRGYGLLLDRDEVSYARFRTAGQTRWGIEVESARLDYTVFAGPTELDALRRFTTHVGHQPRPERWWFGPWYQSGHANHVPLDEEAKQAETLQAAGAAASAVETHCRYLPFGEDQGFERDETARTTHAHDRGLAILSYLNPMVAREYDEAYAAAQGRRALIRNDAGEPYLFQAYVGGREPPHTLETQYDFSHPAAPGAWAAVAGKLVAAGYDGWMEDFGEYTPLDASLADGTTGTAAHNLYPTLYHRAAADVAARLEAEHGRRLARFVRSGWTGAAAFSPIVWGGDPTTTWGFDGLASALIEGLSMGASGVAMWGSDTGGFLSTLDQLTPELLIRWIQFSAFCPVMRTKASGIEIPVYPRPQIWDEDVLPAWRTWSRWHTRLNDYLMAAHDTYRRTGRPIMCALELTSPGLGAGGPIEDQYLLGPDLLVAPVLEPGATHRRVTLPEGRWLDFFDPRGQPAHTGPAVIDIEAPLDRIPVLVRAGAVIGLLPEDVRTLSPYAPALPHNRHVLAWPDRTSAGTIAGALGPAHRFASSWRGTEWTLRLEGPGETTWDIELRHPSGTHTETLEGANPTLSYRYP